jgi:site-specific recombinase XerD
VTTGCGSYGRPPLFRRLARNDAITKQPMSDRAVARLVQACARKAGFDPSEFTGHSLRAGFLTEGARQGASVFKLQQVSMHRSLDVLSAYVHHAELFLDHAGGTFL